MQDLCVSPVEFEEFRDFQVQQRWDWPAIFSCNMYRQVWPFNAYGYTDETRRMYLEGHIPLLDQIVEMVLLERSEGGRFFIGDEGVFLRPDEELILIVRFIFRCE